MSGKMQNVVALAATLGATAVAKKAADATWKASAGKEPPTDPADPDVELREAIVWAIISGTAISVARMLIARRMAQTDRRKAKVAKAVHP
jgi:hypothetical protein